MIHTIAMTIATIDSLSLEEKIGQMLLVGYPAGRAGMDILRGVVGRRPVGNIILFSRNGAPPDALYDQLGDVRSLVRDRTGVDPLVALDQEGGIVTRLKDGFTPLPGAMAMAAAVAGGGASLEDVEAMAFVAGSELKAMGIDWNLAPVVDINVNRDNPVIGVRSFGEDPGAVADLVSAYARGLARAGVAATAKHFPGHGDTNVDSHLGLPVVDADAARLDAVELVPFRRLIAEGVAAVMSAHALFPAVEPEAIPATLSRRALTGLLRERLGFGGVVVTDCLEMKAVHGRYEDVAVRAVLAGADVLCISHTASLQEEAFDALLAAVRSGAIPQARIDESAGRVLAAKAAVAAKAAPGGKERALASLRSPAAIELSSRISDASISLVSGRNPSGASGGLYIDVRPELQTGAEDAREAMPSMAAAALAVGASFDVVDLPVDPEPADVARAVARVGAGPVVIGTYAYGKHPRQAALASAVAAVCDASGASLFFAAMRDPYDAAALAAFGGKERTVVCAYEHTELSLRAVARVFSGEAIASGACPVEAV